MKQLCTRISCRRMSFVDGLRYVHNLEFSKMDVFNVDHAGPA